MKTLYTLPCLWFVGFFCLIVSITHAQNEDEIRISGTLLMLDDTTSHVAVVVQVVTPTPDDKGEPTVVATTLSDERGKYQFINLKPGQYQVRCYTSNGYVYYTLRQDADGIVGITEVIFGKTRDILRIEPGETPLSVDFRFAPFKKGAWKTYTPFDGLVGNTVEAICSAPDGTLWVGSNGGVSRYDGEGFVNFTTKDGLVHNSVSAIYRDPDGVLWFGTVGGGISRYDGAGFVNFTTKDGLANLHIKAIYRDADGVMWFGTAVGVSRYDGKGFVNFTLTDRLADPVVHRMLIAPDGVVWFGTEGGISRYYGKEVVNFTEIDGMLNHNIYPIHRDPDGVLWFGTWGGGISRYDGKNFVNFTTKDGLANPYVKSIYRDPNGTLWFGTTGGVSRYDERAFFTLTTADGLGDNRVNAIHRDPDGVLWFGTGLFGGNSGGVSRYDGKSFVNFTRKDGLESDCVRAIRRASDGVLWAGTVGAFGGREEKGGASRYDPPRSPLTKGGSKGGFVTLTQEDGLADNWVRSIYGDPDGTIWFGTYDGLSRYDGKGFLNFRYDGKGFLNYTLEEGMVVVNAIHRAPDGVLWVGISGSFGARGGVYRYNGKEFVNFTIEDGLASHNVLAIHSDSDGVMWFGTWGDGVYRYDGSVPLEEGGRGGKALVKFTQKDGLVDNAVSSIYRAPDGVMWFGTGFIINRGGGVSAYDGITWTSLDTRDGLAGDTVLAIHPDPDGSLWFGTEGGVTRYQRGQTPPSVHIVSVKTDQLYTDLEAVPAFTTGTRVTIVYRAIDLKTLPEKRQYRYRIQEIDADWGKPTKETTFDGAFSKPGTYTFAVQAIDRDLNYSKPATLTLHVKRPWWMYAIGGMTIAGIPLIFAGFYFGKRLQTQRAITQQFNPYIAGRVVGEDLFYGRSDLITDIERTLANNCFLLYGERRIGKTSLQHQLRERLGNADDPTYRFIPAYIDLQGVTEDDFFRTIATGIVDAVGARHASPLPSLRLTDDDLADHRYSYRDLNRDLRTIIDHLKENEPKTIKLVLLMDEVDTLNTYSLRTNLNLRGLFMGPLKENLVLVMSGLYLKMDWSAEGGGSPPFNFLSREIEIQPLDEDSARKLITEPVKGFYTYETKAIDLILSLSELRPFTIQGFCLRAMNRVLADGRTKITVDNIEGIKDSVLAEVNSIRGERAGTSLPGSLNEALSQITNLEAELAQARKQAV